MAGLHGLHVYIGYTFSISETSRVLSKNVVSSYICTNNAREFQFPHFLDNTWDGLLNFIHSASGCAKVSYCSFILIFSKTTDVELLVCLFVIHISSLVKYQSKSFPSLFGNCLSVNSLYIMYTGLLYF